MKRALAAFLFVGSAIAAELKPETVAAWNDYVHLAEARMQERARVGPFLWIDQQGGGAREVRDGRIAVASGAAQNPLRVPSGLIHDWVGAVFLPDARLEDVLATLRDYDHYSQFYAPYVLNSRLIERDGRRDRFSVLLMNRAVLTRTATEGDYESTFCRIGARRAYSISRSIRLQQVADYGESDQHKLPPDRGGGYLWRLESITRIEERDGGVVLEVEAMALSRDIPFSLRWFVEPIVRRTGRGSIETSLRQTRDAVVPRFAPTTFMGR